MSAQRGFNSPKPAKKKSATSATISSQTKGKQPVYAQPGSPIAAAVQRKKNRPGPSSKAQAAAAATASEKEDERERQAVFSPVYKSDTPTKNVDGAEREALAHQRRISAEHIKPQLHVPAQEPDAEEEMDDEYIDEDEFDPFLFIKNLPALTPEQINRQPCIPKKVSDKISLALDLDETLVHCSVQPIEKAELTFNVSFNGTDYEVFVRTRPNLHTFLEQVSQWFEVIVFTASQKVYADKLLNILDPKRKYIHHRVFRDSCVCIDGNYLKDLHILGRDLKTTAIVDNSVQAFGFQLDNGIPIESWFDDEQDNELLNLIPFLRTMKDCDDVRPLIRSTFRLQEFVNSL